MVKLCFRENTRQLIIMFVHVGGGIQVTPNEQVYEKAKNRYTENMIYQIMAKWNGGRERFS